MEHLRLLDAPDASVGLDDVKQIRTALGGTVNDVVLALITAGLRALLIHRGELAALKRLARRADRPATGVPAGRARRARGARSARARRPRGAASRQQAAQKKP